MTADRRDIGMETEPSDRDRAACGIRSGSVRRCVMQQPSEHAVYDAEIITLSFVG